MEEIKKAFEDKKLVLGTKVVLKNLVQNKLQKIYFSKNAPKETLKEIELIAKNSKVKIEYTGLTNEEFGLLCRKQFNINVLGLLK